MNGCWLLSVEYLRSMKSELTKKIKIAIKTAGYDVLADFSLEQTPKPEMGDFATNVAMVIAGTERNNPREVAEKIKTELEKYDDVIKVEIAGPGFINITLSPDLYLAELAKIVEQKENYGRTKIGEGKKVNVEYISANPTGPLHIGNARGGPIGEALANLFHFQNYEVAREFYVNDIGGQADRFGKSLLYWYQIKNEPNLVFPEDGYPGEYIKEISEEIQTEQKLKLKSLQLVGEQIVFFRDEGIKKIVDGIKSDVALLNIKFDVWSYQSKIEESKKSHEIIQNLKDKSATVEKDGALWFKKPGDDNLEDKESVLIKSDSQLTYFADDIAYHQDKIDRGFDKLIDVWGANHSGHVPRMKAALTAIGNEPEVLEIILYQFVRLKRSGVTASMSKRAGDFVTLRSVIEGGAAADAFKYFILAQNPNTPFDFDVDLAADTSEKNPVFYIKYAHARICSILAKAGIGETQDFSQVNYSALKNPKELALIKELVKFPELIEEISINFQIQALPHFVYKIAGLFHDFYSTCRVIGAETKELEQARLALILATKYVLKNSLNILGIEAPEKM